MQTIGIDFEVTYSPTYRSGGVCHFHAGYTSTNLFVKFFENVSKTFLCLLQYVLTGILFSLHLCVIFRPLLLHTSTCFDYSTKLCSCLNVPIQFFIRISPIFFIADERIQSSATFFIIHIFA